MVSELIENSEEATSLRDEPLFFWRGGMRRVRNIEKELLAGSEKTK